MRRRDIFRVILMPQLMLLGIACLLSFIFAGKLAAKGAFTGGVMVLIGSLFSSFVALGPIFSNAGVALARIMIAETLKIFIVLFLLAKVLMSAKLPALAVLTGFGLTLLGTFFSFGLLKDTISLELIERIKAERMEEERLEAERLESEGDDW